MILKAVAEEVAPGLTKLIRTDTGAELWLASHAQQVLLTYSEDHARRWLSVTRSGSPS